MTQAPKNGWRLWEDGEGEIRLSQIVGGMVYEAEVPERLRDQPLGYYDPDWNLLVPDAEIKAPDVRVSRPSTLHPPPLHLE